jgi:hypothetical protein
MIMGVVAMACAAWLGGCSDSRPSRRNIEVVYRFENLRKETGGDPKAAATGLDEWSSVKSILDRASTKPVTVNRFGVRTLGTLEIANYEAKCMIPSLVEFSNIQSDLEALGAADRAGRQRVETYLSQVSATYKSNFVLATVTVAVSGASVSGNRVRIYGMPGEAPVEATVGSTGIWSARLSVVPETKWVYGLSEDPLGRSPTQYFRVNVTTRQQERVEEKEFRKLFPPDAAPGKAAAPAEKSQPPSSSRDDRLFQERRKREEEEIRKRREEENKRAQEARSGTGNK